MGQKPDRVKAYALDSVARKKGRPAKSDLELLNRELGSALANARIGFGDGAFELEWVFMDESRNRSRQWCQMEVCGNRAKARRHYARTRSKKPRARKNPRRSRKEMEQ